jgi:prepilin-type N-terminal cleavage/methylation domain-containing protein
MTRSRQRLRAQPRARPGFTVVELIVAIMIFSVGALAMAGTAARVMTMLTSAQTRTIAAGVAEARFEQLRGTPCSAQTSGSATTRGISEQWTIVKLSRADDVTVVVSFTADHRSKTAAYRSWFPCF